jgi:hypothetical protein
MSDKGPVVKGILVRLNSYRTAPAYGPGSATTPSGRNKGGNIMRTWFTIASLIVTFTAGTAFGQDASTSPTSVCELGSYACPNHPEFQATWPAQCPVCHEVLSKRDTTAPTLVADQDQEHRGQENRRREETRQREEQRGRSYYRYNYPYGYYYYPPRRYAYPYPNYGYVAPYPLYGYRYYPDQGYYYNPNTGYYYYPNQAYYYSPGTGYYYYPNRGYYYNPNTGYYYYPNRRYYYNPYTGQYYYPQ